MGCKKRALAIAFMLTLAGSSTMSAPARGDNSVSVGLMVAVPAARTTISKRLSYVSDKYTVNVDVLQPADHQKHTLVIILHGSGGMHFGPNKDVIQRFQQKLAAQGYTAAVIHYFDRTATAYSTLTVARKNFLIWEKTIRQGIELVSQQPEVNGQKICLLGFSLGSYLSLSLASQEPQLYAAVVEFSGGLPAIYADRLKKMPPVLILHGSADKTVKVSEANNLERLFNCRHVVFEKHIYPDEGHNFAAETEADAFKRTLQFLNIHAAP